MKENMRWIHSNHEAWFRAALENAQGYTKEGEIDLEYGTALYILTGMSSAWSRLERFLNRMDIDFPGMMSAGLSSGETLMVALAWNLFNANDHPMLSPVDLVTRVDDGMFELVVNGLYLRKYGFPQEGSA